MAQKKAEDKAKKPKVEKNTTIKGLFGFSATAIGRYCGAHGMENPAQVLKALQKVAGPLNKSTVCTGVSGGKRIKKGEHPQVKMEDLPKLTRDQAKELKDLVMSIKVDGEKPKAKAKAKKEPAKKAAPAKKVAPKPVAKKAAPVKKAPPKKKAAAGTAAVAKVSP